jgi:hypothetical protein
MAPLMGMILAGPKFRLNSAIALKQEAVVAHGSYGIVIPDSAQQIEYGISITTAFETIAKLQDQLQESIGSTLEQCPTVPKQGMEVYNAWIGTYNQARQTFKKAMDDNFDTWLDYMEKGVPLSRQPDKS